MFEKIQKQVSNEDRHKLTSAEEIRIIRKMKHYYWRERRKYK